MESAQGRALVSLLLLLLLLLCCCCCVAVLAGDLIEAESG